MRIIELNISGFDLNKIIQKINSENFNPFLTQRVEQTRNGCRLILDGKEDDIQNYIELLKSYTVIS